MAGWVAGGWVGCSRVEVVEMEADGVGAARVGEAGDWVAPPAVGEGWRAELVGAIVGVAAGGWVEPEGELAVAVGGRAVGTVCGGALAEAAERGSKRQSPTRSRTSLRGREDMRNLWISDC